MSTERPDLDGGLAEATYRVGIYTEILAIQKGVLHGVNELATTHSAASRHEVELADVPTLVALIERFRQRLGYWESRRRHLAGLDGVDQTPF